MIDLYRWISKYSEKIIWPLVGFIFGCLISIGNEWLKGVTLDALYLDQPLTMLGFFVSALILSVYLIIYICYLVKVKETKYPIEFNKLMSQNTIQLLVDVNKGLLSWGANKCFFNIRHLVEGVKSENVQVDHYDDDMYQMSNWHNVRNNQQILNDYENYIQSEQFQSVIQRGDNLPRFMLTDCFKNHNKNKEIIVLRLKRTEWSQCSFVWDFYKNHPDVLRIDTLNAFNLKGQASPNSLSLHLIIETNDRKIVLASIGSKKFNDYPNSIAATLGEQIELTDFLSQNSYNDSFLDIWVKRACVEEFCLTDMQYQILFDKASIRLLGITFEGDIYNFAMATTIKLNVSFEEFYTVIKASFNQMEANDFYPLDITKIPEFILNIGNFDFIGPSFTKHPSTDYRLLLMYLHHYGLRHGCQKIVKCNKCKSKRLKEYENRC